MEARRYQGIVQKGKRRGGALGFPTINIPLKDKDVSGIYAGRVFFKDEAPYMAAVYADQKRGLLEANLLDFNDDLYGLDVQIELLEKIRESERFDDEAALRAAIARDIEEVRKYFSH